MRRHWIKYFQLAAQKKKKGIKILHAPACISPFLSLRTAEAFYMHLGVCGIV